MFVRQSKLLLVINVGVFDVIFKYVHYICHIIHIVQTKTMLTVVIQVHRDRIPIILLSTLAPEPV